MLKRRAATIDERRAALTLAALAGCDERTAVRALREGADVIRVLVVRERVRDAMRELHVGASFGDASGSTRGERIGD